MFFASKILRPIGLGLSLAFSTVTTTRLVGADEPQSADFAPRLQRLEERLAKLARRNRIPGMSGAVVLEGEIRWARGFGFADREEEIPATENTLYRLASVSKPFAAVLLLQLVEEGKLSLDQPMNGFTIHPWFLPNAFPGAHSPSRYDDPSITVRHLLTHTSASPPGTRYRYDGNLFNDLTWVIEGASGLSYPDALKIRILDRARMDQTPKGHLDPASSPLIRNLAKAYEVVNRRVGEATYPGFGIPPDFDVSPWNLSPAFELPPGVEEARRKVLAEAYTPLYSSTAASGLLTSVVDLAKFDVALDGGELLKEESRRRMFTAHRAPDGTALPYGLGWFVEEKGGTAVVWHYGWFPPTVSALYVKIPEKEATFLLLANCDSLSAGFSFTRSGVSASPYANAFLEEFLSEN